MQQSIDNKKARFSEAPWAKNTRDIIIGGAGGIGSWMCLTLARIGHSITVYDFDTVDEVNMAGQLFAISDIYRAKVTAIGTLVKNLSGTDMNLMKDRFTSDSWAQPIMIAAFDNMEARTTMFERWLTQGDSAELFLDGRMSAEYFEIYAVTRATADDYRKTLFDDAEAASVPCSFKATTHNAMGIAYIMTGILNNFLSGDFSGFRKVPFRTEFNLQLFSFEYSELLNEVPAVMPSLDQVEGPGEVSFNPTDLVNEVRDEITDVDFEEAEHIFRLQDALAKLIENDNTVYWLDISAAYYVHHLGVYDSEQLQRFLDGNGRLNNTKNCIAASYEEIIDFRVWAGEDGLYFPTNLAAGAFAHDARDFIAAKLPGNPRQEETLHRITEFLSTTSSAEETIYTHSGLGTMHEHLGLSPVMSSTSGNLGDLTENSHFYVTTSGRNFEPWSAAEVLSRYIPDDLLSGYNFRIKLQDFAAMHDTTVDSIRSDRTIRSVDFVEYVSVHTPDIIEFRDSACSNGLDFNNGLYRGADYVDAVTYSREAYGILEDSDGRTIIRRSRRGGVVYAENSNDVSNDIDINDDMSGEDVQSYDVSINLDLGSGDYPRPIRGSDSL